MAISTYKTYLLKKNGSGSSATYTKVVDIKDFPDLGSEPENLDTTTLSDSMHTYIAGIQDVGGALQFTANYDKTEYTTLLTETASATYAVAFGGTLSGTTWTGGTDSQGKWEFTGTMTVYPLGKGVNEVQEMMISITPSSTIEFVA